jgi:DNA-binding CsgD family transcriptional regulator
MAALVVGRDAELAALRDFLAGISDGAALFVLEGEAGMGKTTLWRATVEQATDEDVRTLQAQPAESEAELSFAGLGDLLDPMLDEALAPLPPGQRSALARALVLEDVEGTPPDAHAVGVALLGAFRALSASGRVLVAVDDVQWLDAASASALAYAGRRLRGECFGFLFARRTGLRSSVADEVARSFGERTTRLDVGPLDPDALHRVLQDRLGATLPRPLLAEIRQASGGNPFYAIEIVRTLQRRGVEVEAGRPLPVPDSLHDLVDERLTALSDESRHFLLAAAAHAHPTVAITEGASGVGADAGLAPAIAAGIVELEDSKIRFTHPLLAAGAYEIADPLRRREIHARLAEALEDPEARAWQLAASVDRPDEDVAAALEEAARIARGRGAPRPAALLLERASELTPGDRDVESRSRSIDAAYLHYESGDSTRAEAMLRTMVSELAPGSIRARALVRLARVRAYEALDEAVELFRQASDEAEGDQELLAVAHEGAATCLWRSYERLEEAFEHADLAARLALEQGDDALAGEALGTRLAAELLLGRETAAATAELALARQPAAVDRRVLAQPISSIALDFLGWNGQLERARAEMTQLLRTARELGDESSRPFVLAHLGLVECELGELPSAGAHALEGLEAAEQSGQRAIYAFNLAVRALVDAYAGREDSARDAGLRALELARETVGRQAELVAVQALGHLELALGEAGEAVARLEPTVAFVRRESIVEPGVIGLEVDYVEALLELGRRDEAVEQLDWYEGNARRLERVPALANCARCRGLLAAHAGDLDAAVAAFDEAVGLHAKVEIPLDRGRTLLALGAAQRRTKRRREARATLEEALAVFERIGAALWAERARSELKRISGRAATPGALTPAEERVAVLVAEGKTNKEVAAALFLSDRTVEGHLAHVFGKLGIRHRTEVARALQIQGSTGPKTGDRPVSAESPTP